jgi:hypothetical protein
VFHTRRFITLAGRERKWIVRSQRK